MVWTIRQMGAKSIIVFGKASNKIVKAIPIPTDYRQDLSLMDFLREKNITIASSCGGVGTCQKCTVNEHLLSCQITLKDFILNYPTLVVEISYL